jgi:alpha-amylase/alpha-mannosidase (GH57 family)
MHQPQYLNLANHSHQLPWCYLHGIRDYMDMAVILEQNPKAKAVFNFSPILLEQIEGYSNQIRNFFDHNHGITDPLLAALVEPALPKDHEHYLALLKQCLKVNQKYLLDRFPKYQELINQARFIGQNPRSLSYITKQYLPDLITWFHIIWMAETKRENDPRIKKLMEKNQSYSMHDRLLVLEVIGEQLSSIIPLYRKLIDCGQIELSMSPYSHPILPLLLDFNSARQALPSVELPTAKDYPDGLSRCRWQIEQGQKCFERHFGKKPSGCWPSEGAISHEVLSLLNSFGFKWTASGQQVLQNSLNLKGAPQMSCLHHPFTLPGMNLNCFFRDDRLSDLIGFTYQDWHGDDAANNLIHELERIAAKHATANDKVVSIILDGENCWEYYPHNGFFFLDALYEKLSHHPNLKLCTFEECVTDQIDVFTLPSVVAGSWVYGNFSTWIGDQDKNKAWDALVAANIVFGEVTTIDSLDDEQKSKALEQLAICEGSDWFWWLGDYNPADSVSDFETLFRTHLANLYRYLGQEVPENLTQVLSEGYGSPESSGVSGVMKRSQQ